jgi:hypothetical protein
MIELEWIVNEKTGEKHLYYRELPGKPPEIHWKRVPTKTLEESSYDDLIESGGIVGAP